MDIHEVVDRIGAKTGHYPKRSGQGYSARCPAHDDKNPSLSIAEGSDSKILFTCFAGCSLDSICASLDIQTKDLFPDKIERVPDKPLKTVYDYCDEKGRKLYSKVRMEPGFNGRRKSFYWERVDETAKTHKNLNGCRRVFYRLPELLRGISEGKSIYLVEGEKDADRLIQCGLVATTTTDTLRWDPSYTKILENADAVILFDYDKAGFERRDLLCRELHGKVGRLRVVDLQGLEYQENHGQDVSDWLAMGNTTAKLLEIVTSTPDYQPDQKISQENKICVVSFEDFLKMELPKQEMLLDPFLTTQGLALLYAKRGVGKTHVALGIAYAVASGGQFLNWSAPIPRRVLYIDGEMPASAMQERLRRITVTEGQGEPMPSYLRLMTPDLQKDPMPDLSTREGRTLIDEFIEESDLIIVDNLSTLFRGGVENEAESWQPVQEWALELRRRGKAVLFVHHAGKGGQQRGTSKKEDILDVVINLKQPDNHKAEDGASFEVHFEKIRHFAGIEAASFQVMLKEEVNGLWRWEVSNICADPKIKEVADLVNEGLTIKEIMEKTDLSKSKVETKIKKARQIGLVNEK